MLRVIQIIKPSYEQISSVKYQEGTNRETRENRFSSSLNWLGLLLLFIAVVLIPSVGATYLNGTMKCMAIAAIISFWMLHQFRTPQKGQPIYFIDVLWGILIIWTGVSAFWAQQSNLAIYGLFTTLLLFLAYQVFQAIVHDPKIASGLFKGLTILFLISVGLQTYNLRANFTTDTYIFGDESFMSSMGEVNHHWLGGFQLIVLPFLLFKNYRFSKLFGWFALLTALVLSMVAGSAQVTVGGLMLLCFYIIFLLKVSLDKIVYFGVGTVSLLGLGLLFLYGQTGTLQGHFFLIDEFYDQSDRFWMWRNSWQLFLENPLTGIGKNNWEILSGQFGFEGCYYCSQSEFTVNRFKHAHNGIFQTISELGVVGVSVYGLMSGLISYRLWSNRQFLSNFHKAALASLFLFLLICMMYGIVYNYFDHFQGLPIISVFSLAVLHQATNPSPLINLNFKVYTIFSFLLGMSCLLYFYKFQGATSDFKVSQSNINKEYNLGQTEIYSLNTLNYFDRAKSNGQLGDLFKSIGYNDLAIQAYEKAMLADPTNVIMGTDLGNLFFQKKDFSAAEKLATSMYQLAPSYLPNTYLLMSCYAQSDKQELMIPLAKKWEQDLLNKLAYYESAVDNIHVGTKIKKWNYYLLGIQQLLKKEVSKDSPSSKRITNWATLDKFFVLPKVLQHTTFQIDEISEQLIGQNAGSITIKKDQTLVVRGWAIDTYSKTAAGGVFIEFSDEIYRARYSSLRKDVATVLGNESYEKSGFLAHIPAEKLQKGEYTLKIWVLNSDHTTLYSPSKAKQLNIIVE